MAEYLIQDTTLTSIANAIREKTGSTGTIKPVEFSEQIRKILYTTFYFNGILSLFRALCYLR